MLCTEFSRRSASRSSASLEMDEADCGYILSLNLYNKGNGKSASCNIRAQWLHQTHNINPAILQKEQAPTNS